MTKRFVYFIRCTATRLVKIGSAQDAKKRLAMLQIGSAPALVLERVAPGGFCSEYALHKRYKDRHVRGEWFRLTKKEVIEAVVDDIADDEGAIDTTYDAAFKEFLSAIATKAELEEPLVSVEDLIEEFARKKGLKRT